jgi:hypothetical protein
MNSVTLDPPQPRGDVLVRDLDGVDRRRTEYVGTAWIDGRPVIEGLALRPQQGGGPKGIRVPFVDVAFFVPDSLPYTRDRLGGATLSLSTVLQGGEGTVLHAAAEFVDDPSGAPTWIHVRINAHAPWPTGIGYRIVAMTAPDAAG